MKLKELPEQHYLSHPIPNDTKKVFYVGTSDLISEHKTDIYKTNYGIYTLQCENKNSKIYKIGVTKDLNIRLKYYQKEIIDFRVLKSWNIKNPITLEKAILSYYEKSDYDSFGSEWFWDTNSLFENLIEQIEWFIDNSYTKVGNHYEYLFKKT